jgi:hypothetical protein
LRIWVPVTSNLDIADVREIDLVAIERRLLCRG